MYTSARPGREREQLADAGGYVRRTVWLGFLDLDGELLEPGDAAPQELVDALDDAVHVRERRAPGGVRPGRVVRGGGGRELDVDAADDARVVLWPEARARERREALDARELRRVVSVCTREGGERDRTKGVGVRMGAGVPRRWPAGCSPRGRRGRARGPCLCRSRAG